MTHNNEVTREAAGLNAICYLIPLGFTTLSGSCQVFLTHKMLVEINLKYDAQFTHMFLHALLLHPHFNYLEGPGFEFRG